MIAALSVIGGILSSILVFVLGVWTVKNTNKAKLATDELAAQTKDNSDDTARLRDDTARLQIESDSYVRARAMDHEVVEGIREELDRVRDLVIALRVELVETKAALLVSERNTARAERNVQTLRDLLITRGITVPDLEGGNGAG